MFFLKELPTKDILERYHERFPGMQVDVVEEALLLMRRASLLIRKLDDYFTGHDFSQLRYLILVVIDREQDQNQMTVTLLATKMDVSKPVMTRTLKSLAEAGFITISHDQQDKRAKLVELTKAGRKKLHAILPGYYETIETFMSQRNAVHA